MSTKNIVAISIVLIAGAVYLYAPPPPVSLPVFTPTETPLLLTPNGTAISLFIADTEPARAEGLGNRASLPRNQGMLFVFFGPGIYPFWMKGMQFPLDIIWLAPASTTAQNEQGLVTELLVVDMLERVSPDTYPELFTPSGQSVSVLELNSGVASESGIQKGSLLRITR